MDMLMHFSLVLLKAAFLLYAVVFTSKYWVCCIHSKDISEGTAWKMGLGIVGFVTLQWLV